MVRLYQDVYQVNQGLPFQVITFRKQPKTLLSYPFPCLSRHSSLQIHRFFTNHGAYSWISEVKSNSLNIADHILKIANEKSII